MFESVEFDDKQRQDEFIAEIDQINPDLLQRAITSSCPRCKKVGVVISHILHGYITFGMICRPMRRTRGPTGFSVRGVK